MLNPDNKERLREAVRGPAEFWHVEDCSHLLTDSVWSIIVQFLLSDSHGAVNVGVSAVESPHTSLNLIPASWSRGWRRRKDSTEWSWSTPSGKCRRGTRTSCLSATAPSDRSATKRGRRKMMDVVFRFVPPPTLRADRPTVVRWHLVIYHHNYHLNPWRYLGSSCH